MPRAVAILNGDRLRQDLCRLNLTQSQFAAITGLRQMTISDAINDKPLLPDTIYRICLGLERLNFQKERKEGSTSATPSAR